MPSFGAVLGQRLAIVGKSGRGLGALQNLANMRLIYCFAKRLGVRAVLYRFCIAVKTAGLSLPALTGLVLLANVERSGATAGAITPFTSYEAEAGTIGGGASIISLAAPPTNQYSSAELEASGHAYVRLDATGEYVEWTNNTAQNITAINVRECIPDAPAGGGISATLNLYVD